MTDREQYPVRPAGRRSKGRREVDARSRQGTAPLAGKVWQALTDPRICASGRPSTPMEPGDGWQHGEAHHGGSAHAARDRNNSDASRRSKVLGTTGVARHAVGARSSGGGTRLTLWPNIDRRFISMGAAGWHICFDVLDHLLGGTPIGRIVGPEAMKFGGWQRLNAEYADSSVSNH